MLYYTIISSIIYIERRFIIYFIIYYNDAMKKKTITYISLFALVILLSSAAYITFLKLHQFEEISALKSINNYSIHTADDTFLDKYIDKNNNTLVVFWSSLCSHCLNEAEELNNFIVSNNTNLKIIIVSHDYEYSDLEEYLKEHNYNWNVILDTDKTIRNHIDPGASGIPASYLLNKNGEIINYYKGELNFDEFTKFINLENIEKNN